MENKYPEVYNLEIRNKKYWVTAHGLMSYRQYFDAREDPVIDEILRLEWKTIGYIGASYGLQAMILSNYGTVIALEPVQCIFDAMCHNIKVNNMNVIPIMVGLSNIDGFIELTHSGHLGPTPSENIEGEIPEKVQMIKFGHPILNCVDSLFIDIEGSEALAFNDTVQINENIKFIVMEMHYQFYDSERTNQIFATLKRNGFQTIKKIYSRGEQEHLLFRK
jgi:FkbM family methyltransferase